MTFDRNTNRPDILDICLPVVIESQVLFLLGAEHGDKVFSGPWLCPKQPAVVDALQDTTGNL